MKNVMKLLSIILVVSVLSAALLTFSGFAGMPDTIPEESEASAEESAAPNLKNFITNGSFDENLNGWKTSGASWADGKAKLTVNGNCSLSQDIAVVGGTTYTISGTISGAEGMDIWNWLYGRIGVGDIRYDTIQIFYNTQTSQYGKNANADGYFEVEFNVPSSISSINLAFECATPNFSFYIDDLFMTDGVTEVEEEPSEIESEIDSDIESTTSESTVDSEDESEKTSETGADTSEVVVVKYGDVNGDDNIDLKDVLMLRKSIAGLGDLTVAAAADVNGDGNVDLKDVLMLRKYIANLIDTLGPMPL